MERYPRMICGDCNKPENIRDSRGNSVIYENEDIYGGIVSIHNINGTNIKGNDYYCFVKNIACYAQEARFGGIVIQVL